MRSHGPLHGALIAAAVVVLMLGCDPGTNSLTERRLMVTAAAQSTATGAMTYSRSAFTLTRLANGKVLAAGGYGSTGANVPGALPTAEVFDPVTGTWSLTGSMANPRMNHTATVLSNGKVLVTGGWNVASVLASTELYDPATGQWSPAATMSISRMIHTATLLDDGRVLVAGGAPDTGAAATASCALYDPATGAWSPTGSLTTPRRMHTAALTAGGKVTVAYGWGDSGAMASGADLYDPATGAWSATAASQYSGLARQTAFALPNGRALFAAGESSTGGLYGSARLFDPATGSWTVTGSFAPRRDAAGVVLGDGRALLLGGGQANALATVDGFDPATSTWSSLPPLLTPRDNHGAILLEDGRILVAGGAGLMSAEIYQTTCTAATCSTAGASCGTIPDGCGGTLSCGSCADGEVCSSNACCAPLTCAATGVSCGTISDGCGGTLSCGLCADGEVCSGNACCAPTTCAALGATCGAAPDGCGGTLACGTCAPAHSCLANVCVASPTTAAFDTVLKAPRCVEVSPECDSNTLLVGRGPLGPEPSAPNTLGSTCLDGGAGTLHSDESLDRLRISSVDGGPLTGGKAARIDATVWAYTGYTSDKLDLYSAADASNPVWTFLGTLTPASSGAQTLDLSFTLPLGPVQAIRGTFRFGGTASTCTTGGYDDHDDLVFAVTPPTDAEPPTVGLTAPAEGSTVTGTVDVNASATDDAGIARVDFMDGAQVLAIVSAPPYTIAWDTREAANGPHTLTAVAWDVSGKSAVSPPVEITVANDLTPPTVSLGAPAPDATVSGAVQVSSSATDDVAVARVEFYDGATLIGSSTAAPYGVTWNTLVAANGSHALTAKAYDTSGNEASSAIVMVTVANTAVVLTAAYDAVRHAPTCAMVGTGCDTGTLVNGRGPVGPEPNAPNTINGSCSDGASGKFHSDESVDRLRVVTLDSTPLAAGKAVRVETTVWAWSTVDRLDVYYAANAASPTWTLVGTVAPTASGAQTLTATYTLPAGASQAVRVNFRYTNTAGPCTTGGYDDRDDLVFAVQ